MTTLVLQPDAANGIDTFITSAFGTNNYGTFGSIYAGVQSTTTYKGLIAFDLSSVPSNAIIDSAILELYMFDEFFSSSYVLHAFRSLVQWFEGAKAGATPSGGEDASVYNLRNYNGSVAWAGGAGGAAGSDYASTETASVTVTSLNTWYSLNVTADIAAFMAGTYSNYGWWLTVTSGSGSRKVFYSSDHTTASLRPKLTITYHLPEIGGTASGTSTVTAHLMSRREISGTAAGTSDAHASLIDQTRSGTAAGTSTATAHLQGRLVGSGSAAGAASAHAGIMGRGLIGGAAAGVASASATGARGGIMRGSAAGVADAHAYIWGKAIHVVPRYLRHSAPLLYLSDGLETFNLLDPKVGYCLCAWRPTVAQYKQGGEWTESPLSNGRRLVRRVFDDAIEVMRLSGTGKDQDELIAFTNDLFRWIEAAADYWTNRWADRPVYLGARSAFEKNIRYALIHAASVPELNDVYSQAFFSHPTRAPRRVAFEEITLRMQRGPWRDEEPGESTCVAISSTRSWTVSAWASGA